MYIHDSISYDFLINLDPGLSPYPKYDCPFEITSNFLMEFLDRKSKDFDSLFHVEKNYYLNEKLLSFSLKYTN